MFWGLGVQLCSLAAMLSVADSFFYQKDATGLARSAQLQGREYLGDRRRGAHCETAGPVGILKAILPGAVGNQLYATYLLD